MTKFDRLIEIIETLRHPETGCPWDMRQTSTSLIPNFIEEVYEAVEAIEEADDEALCEELGDILLHVIFQIKLAEERKAFTVDKVLSKICDKLVNRHPHIFSDTVVKDEHQVKQNWEKIKLKEKKEHRQSVLDGVPKNMPALIQSQRIQEKAGHIGFDWDDTAPIYDKIIEEINEVKEAIATSTKTEIQMEIGDLLFACVNLARKLEIDAETALRSSTEKFKTRFQQLEKVCNEQQINMSEAGLEKLDELWEYIKKL